MHIVLAVGSLAPETGGPARSVPNLALALADHDVDVSLISIDLGSNYSSPWIPDHPNVKTYLVQPSWTIGMRTIYVPEYKTSLEMICREKENTILHDNGIWLPHNRSSARVARDLNIPLIISPRGMLEPWALDFHRWRKVAAWHLFQRNSLKSAAIIHSASRTEANNIQTIGLRVPIAVVPNGTILPGMDRNLERGNKKRILFLSRIHPNKGLINLVEVMKRVNLKEWELVIAGYDEGNHLKEVQAAVKRANLTNSVIFHGPVRDDEKWSLYASSDLFILPSYSENFGIVVAEALASNLPVVTTTGTPWEDLKRYNCGWWVEPNIKELGDALKEAVELPDQIRLEMGQRGRLLVEEKYTWKAIAAEMLSIYHYLLTDIDPPDSIIFPS
jgi:glycosyltransferase involved in cell wall biosynthesis